MADESHGTAEGALDKHPKLNALLDDMVRAGMTVTKEWKELFGDAIKYAWGQQLQGWSLKDDWEYIVINRIYPLMFNTIAKLAENNPKINTFARDNSKEGLEEFVEKWAGILQHLWESPYKLGMRLKLIMGLLQAAVYGYMVGYTYWEPKAKYDDQNKAWIGDIKETFIHPAFFWVDPSADTIESAENCGMRRKVKLEWAQKRWPKYKNQIATEAFTADDARFNIDDLISYDSQKGDTLEESKKIFSKIVGLILKQAGKNTDDSTGENTQKYVYIDTIFWKDYTEKHVKIEDNVPAKILIQGGQIITEDTTGLYLDAQTKKPFAPGEWPRYVKDEYDEPQFPHGRYVLRVGKAILNPDEKDQVYKESRWPFTVYPYHLLPFMWQGCNAIEMSRNNNDMLNITISSMVNQVRRTADPEHLVERGALAKDRKGKVRQKKPFGLGKIIITARGAVDKVKNLIYPPLDSAVPLLADILKRNIDDQMFMQPVARGEQQKRQITAEESARTDTNANQYTALQAVCLDVWIDNTATLVAELCQRYYEPGRIARMITDDGQENVAMGQEMFDVRFDVNIEPGSTLPFDEERKKNDYAAAYKMVGEPVANPMLEDMLRVLNIAKRKEILQRHQGYLLFLQFIQMGQLLAQVQSEPEVQAVMQQISGIPGIQQLAQLLIQAGQLMPQKKGAA
jgi:hypothetical protein